MTPHAAALLLLTEVVSIGLLFVGAWTAYLIFLGRRRLGFWRALGAWLLIVPFSVVALSVISLDAFTAQGLRGPVITFAAGFVGGVVLLKLFLATAPTSLGRGRSLPKVMRADGTRVKAQAEPTASSPPVEAPRVE